MNNTNEISATPFLRTAGTLLILSFTLISARAQSPAGEVTDHHQAFFDYTQGTHEHTSEPPAFSSTPTEHLFCSNKGDCGATHITLVTSAMDDCTPANHLIYSFKIDLDSDGDVDKKGEGADASGKFPLGKHRIDWSVTDGCGNIAHSSYEFTIRDCQQPKAYCLNGTSVTLDPYSGMKVRVWASELDLSSMDNCGIAELRIASPSGGPGQTLPPPAADFIEFDCQQLGMQSVDVWVRDEGNNWDYCTTYLHVSGSRKACKDNDLQAAAGAVLEKHDRQTGEIQVVESVVIAEQNSSAEGFQLYQNYPNPFASETSIRFYLPEAARARLSIYDAGGRTLKTVENDYQAGMHQIQLKKSGLPGHSVLYYRLDTDTDTKSMIMLSID